MPSTLRRVPCRSSQARTSFLLMRWGVPPPRVGGGEERSSRGGTRTPDPPVNSRLLYQLRYSGLDAKGQRLSAIGYQLSVCGAVISPPGAATSPRIALFRWLIADSRRRLQFCQH